MANNTNKKINSKLIFFILILLVLLYTIYYLNTLRNKVGIFIVEPININYGQTQISGTLAKDSPIDQAGNYLLILPDDRIVILDITNLDNLVGLIATIDGFLIPPLNHGEPMKMMVEKITVKK